MKDKTTGTKITLILYLISGIANFSIFCYDLENDKDWLTYGWLLWTILAFCMFIIQGVKLEVLRNKIL